MSTLSINWLSKYQHFNQSNNWKINTCIIVLQHKLQKTYRELKSSEIKILPYSTDLSEIHTSNVLINKQQSTNKQDIVDNVKISRKNFHKLIQEQFTDVNSRKLHTSQ